MKEINFIKIAGGLQPLSNCDLESVSDIKAGSVISCSFKSVRNPRFHRKFFAMLNIAFDYYEPNGGLLTKGERVLASKIFKSLDNHAGNSGAFLEFGRDFLAREIKSRRGKVGDIKKEFEAFRKEMIMEAGFYSVHSVPSGVRKEAKSISFASMDDIEFNEVYSSVFNACWRMVLSRVFNNKSEVESAVNNMLNFA